MSATSFHYRNIIKIRSSVSLFLILLIYFSGCIEPYAPPASTEDVDILVVDGFLNSGDGSARVTLTHAKPLSSQEETRTESLAMVYVRTESGDEFMLTEQEPGTYEAQGLALDPSEKYQLSVRTRDSQEYQSDYVTTRPSPVIDSIVWGADEGGLNIYVNAHDATGSTRYYRWDYIETWEYDAAVSSDFKVENNQPVFRNNDERMHTCWKTVPSTKISIASTVRLAEDVIYQYPLAYIPKGSQKIQIMYSILVRQRAISKEEYNFMEQLERTTESVGGLFDPQPSQVPGNIHNLSNPSAPVLGYFSAGDATEKRFFLGFSKLPDHLQVFPRPSGCQPDTICVVPSIPRAYQCTMDLADLDGSEIIGSALYTGPFVTGYTKTTSQCADCRTQGGVLQKPSFWP